MQSTITGTGVFWNRKQTASTTRVIVGVLQVTQMSSILIGEVRVKKPHIIFLKNTACIVCDSSNICSLLNLHQQSSDRGVYITLLQGTHAHTDLGLLARARGIVQSRDEAQADKLAYPREDDLLHGDGSLISPNDV